MAVGLASQCIKNDVAELGLSKLGNVQQIIHYEGQITEVINTTLGIYELDKKLQLYFSIVDKLSEDLQIDDHILLSNVHIISVNSHKFLVSCALSSTENLSRETVIATADKGHVELVEEHMACFPDLFMKYNFLNFNSYIAKQFLWNSFYKHLLKTNICADEHANTNPNHFRKWDLDIFKEVHILCIFDIVSNEPFGKDYQVPSISFLVSEAKSRIVWSKHSTKWDHSTVLNNELYVLVGFLYLKENGCFELSDSHTTIPCVFTDDFTPGSNFKRDFVCEVSSGQIGYYVVLRKYCFVFEKFLNGHGMISSYICTSVSYVLPLEQVSSINRRSFCSDPNFSKSSLYDSEIEERNAESTKRYDKSSTLPLGCERTDISVITTLLKENLSLSDKDVRNRKTLKTKYLCLEFKVLLKSWSSEKNKLVYNRAFIFVLNQKLGYVDNEDFGSFIELPNLTEFGEAGAKSDEELVKLMKNLQLQQELEHAVLNFIGSSSKKCSNLRPGHKYRMFIPHRYNMFSSERKKIDLHANKDYGPQVIFINVDRNIKILHSSECFLNTKHADDLFDDHTFEEKNVKDIIKKRNVLTCNVVKGILVDKSFETDYNSQSDKILRLTLKDLETADSIPIYISCYPKSLNGLLPGVVLKLIGCQCISSQKGYLYLRSADSFGFHVLNMHYSSANIIFSTCRPSSINNEDTEIFMLEKLNSRDCPMIFECFNGLVLKITHAQISYACIKCFDCMEKKCLCDSEYMEMIEVSFDVSDGSNVVPMHGTGNILRTLLMLDQNEWNALIKHVLETKQAMKYNYLERSKIPRAFMPRLFHCLCSNTAISRPVYLNCSLQITSDGRNCLTNSCICWNLSEICVQDIAARLYTTLTK